MYFETVYLNQLCCFWFHFYNSILIFISICSPEANEQGPSRERSDGSSLINNIQLWSDELFTKFSHLPQPQKSECLFALLAVCIVMASIGLVCLAKFLFPTKMEKLLTDETERPPFNHYISHGTHRTKWCVCAACLPVKIEKRRTGEAARKLRMRSRHLFI